MEDKTDRIMNDDVVWSQRYRPNRVADVVLDSQSKTYFQKLVDANQIPNLLLAGSTGCGKTTVALALCAELDADVLFLNGSGEDRGIDTVKHKMTRFANTSSIMGGRKVIIVDEADNLTLDAQLALRATIENVSKNCSFILTCNNKNAIHDAVRGRTTIVDFKVNEEEAAQLKAEMFRRVMVILDKEKVEYEKRAVAGLVDRFYPNFRALINELQKFAFIGKIDTTALDALDPNKQIVELIKIMASGKWADMRTWVGESQIANANPMSIIRWLFENDEEVFENKSRPQAIIYLHDAQVDNAVCIDPTLNLVSCLTKIMGACDFKNG